MDERLVQFDEKMQKTMNNLSEEFGSIRAGRANPHVLDKLTVDYYGSPTPIQQVANVSVPEARMIQIQPWEKSMAKPIEKAIRESDLGLNPSSLGELIRVPMPALTEERRRDLTKVVRNAGEDARIAVRNLRRDGNDQAKRLLKDKLISEDEERRSIDDVQKLTDRVISEIDRLVAAKEAEVLAV